MYKLVLMSILVIVSSYCDPEQITLSPTSAPLDGMGSFLGSDFDYITMTPTSSPSQAPTINGLFTTMSPTQVDLDQIIDDIYENIIPSEASSATSKYSTLWK